MTDQILAGVGAKYGVFLPNDATTGLPHPAATVVTPMKGVVVEGIKSVAVTDAEPQRIVHRGDDRSYAQDSLPSADFETIQVTTSKVNLTLDGTLDASKVRQVGTDIQFRAAGNDNKGNEVRGTFLAYRQALDVDRTSDNFGKKRLYNVMIWPSISFSRQTPSFEDSAATDVLYDGTPSAVTTVPWGDAINATNWGVTESAHLEGETLYHPRINSWLADGTIGIWTLSHPAVDSTHIRVWSGTAGSVIPIIAVNSATPSVTIGTVAVGTPIFALIQTSSPNFDA